MPKFHHQDHHSNMRSITALLLLPLLSPATAFQPAHRHSATVISRFHQTSALSSSHSNEIELSRKSFVASSSSILPLSLLLTSTPATANDIPSPPPNTAIYAYRSGGLPRLTTLGFTKLYTRYQGYVVAPSSSSSSLPTKYQNQIPIAFDFPTDWLQLDKLGGGIQYVDQRNGDKLYVLHAVLPEGNDLKSVNKQWFGKS